MTHIAASFADVDVSAFIGAYPFRDVPHPDPEVLVRVLAREGVGRAWVGWLPSAWHRDPSVGNGRLRDAIAPWSDVLEPAPAIRPDWPRWEALLEQQVLLGASAIRAYPAQWGLGPGNHSLTALAHACANVARPLHITVRFEDLRQRHSHDVAGDVPAATVRTLARAGTGCTLVISGGGREFIEEVFWGLTPEERELVWFDFGWVWGPPDDHFAHLLRTMGPSRFVHGSQWPLRLVQQSRALLSLLPDDLMPAVPLPAPTVTISNAARA